MKTLPLAALVVVAGAAIGGGASFATSRVLGPASSATTAGAAAAAPPTFVATGRILAPLVFPTGRLAGYVNFEVQLQVADDRQEFVRARLPFLLHAVNMRTFHTPLASGPDGMLPELATFRSVVAAAAAEAFGPGVVTHVAIVQATPA